MLKNSLLTTAMMALFGAAVLSATPVVVTNFGFEADVLADNAFTTNTFASGWTCSGGSCGAFNPTTASFTPDNPLAAPAQGVNFAYSNGGVISQSVGINVASQGIYTLTVAVGNRLDNAFPGYLVELVAGSTVVATDNTGVTPLKGQFLNSIISYTAPVSGPTIGQALSIRLSSVGIQTAFDNVRLDAAVPEPGTWSMLLIGFGAMAAGIRRKIRA
jgi:hypothetical protein